MIFLSPPPSDLKNEFSEIFPPDALSFLSELHQKFLRDVELLHFERKRKKLDFATGRRKLPLEKILSPLKTPAWYVDRVPTALLNRKLDLGDVSPANLEHFRAALKADVQGIQVDFDDGHCPTWRNNILGHYNVMSAVRNRLTNAPNIASCPVLMFRPRAWNMTEHNMLVKGCAVPGALFDFGLHIYHNSRHLYEIQRGPFFYLSKLESASEAELWDRIFVWAENRLNFPIGTIKATVLIEDIGAAFEMDEILFSLRRHSAGLNCGIWDYCASIVARFHNDKKFLLPDRTKYVNMDKPFLKKYMELAVRVCEFRGTFATGGMAATMASSDEAQHKVFAAKKKEIEEGVAGFMIYDTRLIPKMKELWADSQKLTPRIDPVMGFQLLEIPAGGVTFPGLIYNIRVTLLFIHHWLQGQGHFILENSVEDSATAEISRWQVRQWVQHQALIEGTGELASFCLVHSLVREICYEEKLFPIIAATYLRLMALREPPQFITTYLSDHFLHCCLPDTRSSLKCKF